MTTWLDRNRTFIFLLLSTLAIGGAGLFYVQQPIAQAIEIVTDTPLAEMATPSTAQPTPEPTATATSTPAPVRVYVTGAVAHADVYFLPAGSIVKQAIEAAGGFTAEADPERINLAQELLDQQQIHVPRLGDENPPPAIQGGQPVESSPAPATAGGGPVGGMVNLNTATAEQLDSLPGIGPAIAQRIIEYRESSGGFTSPDQIMEVSGIGPATFEKIENFITIN